MKLLKEVQDVIELTYPHLFNKCKVNSSSLTNRTNLNNFEDYIKNLLENYLIELSYPRYYIISLFNKYNPDRLKKITIGLNRDSNISSTDLYKLSLNQFYDFVLGIDFLLDGKHFDLSQYSYYENQDYKWYHEPYSFIGLNIKFDLSSNPNTHNINLNSIKEKERNKHYLKSIYWKKYNSEIFNNLKIRPLVIRANYSDNNLSLINKIKYSLDNHLSFI